MGRGKSPRNLLLGKPVFQETPESKAYRRAKAAEPDETREDGSMFWKNEKGEYHRDYDLPAIVLADGTREWWKDGERWREDDKPAFVNARVKKWFVDGIQGRSDDLPSAEYTNGDRMWHKGAILHRDGGLPAIERADGSEEYLVEGKYHRIGGPAIVYADGKEEWYEAGMHHRLDGPAVITSEYKMWLEQDLLHRENDLPAVEYADGKKEWRINNKLHREGGRPAIVKADGEEEFWENGERIFKK